MTGLSKTALLDRVGWLITTLGENGSMLMKKGWDTPRRIAAVKVPAVADPPERATPTARA